MSEWIYTEDAMPPERVRVAVAWCRQPGVVLTDFGYWWHATGGHREWLNDYGGKRDNVYAWREHPDPPPPICPPTVASIAELLGRRDAYSIRQLPRTESEWEEVIAFIDAERARRQSASDAG